MVEKVRKRDGNVVEFSKDKIKHVVSKAAKAMNEEIDAEKVSEEVYQILDDKFGNRKIPSVENVQDAVEKALMNNGHADTAKDFILYRNKRQELREAKSALGIDDDMKLSFEALKLLVQYKILKDKGYGKRETPREMLVRVANALSLGDKGYGGDVEDTASKFEESLTNLDVLPSTTILKNAGVTNHLSESYVLQIKDDTSALLDTLKMAVLLHKDQQKTIGIGFPFSTIRSRGSKAGMNETASGPIAFIKIFDSVLQQINPNGCNGAYLSVDHPDILSFLTAKQTEGLDTFGMSVILNKEFMKAVEKDEVYSLIDPHSKEVVTKVRAKSVLDMIATISWQTGDPAVVFKDNLNKSNVFEKELEATIPTGEQPLFPHEGCFTASINLVKHLGNNDFNWEKLKESVHRTVHMLDNAVSVCEFQTDIMKNKTKSTRRIGVGVMGWADALIKLEIPYNSEEALKKAEKIMKFIDTEAKEASIALGKKRGTFSDYKKSKYAEKKEIIRNCARTTIMHSAIRSAIAGCSQGIEPYYAISYLKQTPTSETFEVIPIFERIAKKEGFYSEQLMKKISMAGSVKDIKEIPEKWRNVFVTAHDCSADEHLAVQAAFQKYTNNGVSKTINLPMGATIHEVEDVYIKAHELGCRSVHIYREGSSEQIIQSKK